MNRAFIRILADMVEQALDGRNPLNYASGGHEEALPDLRNEVLPASPMAAVRQAGVQREGVQETPQDESR